MCSLGSPFAQAIFCSHKATEDIDWRASQNFRKERKKDLRQDHLDDRASCPPGKWLAH